MKRPKSLGTDDRILSRLKAILVGFDAFVSYRHSDGRLYAAELESALGKESVSIFRDAREVPPGGRLDSALRAGLRRSTVLVIVSTPDAERRRPGRDWMRDEVRLFLRQPSSCGERFRRLFYGQRRTIVLEASEMPGAQAWPVPADTLRVTAPPVLPSGVAPHAALKAVLSSLRFVRAIRLAYGILAVIFLALAGLTIYADHSRRAAERQLTNFELAHAASLGSLLTVFGDFADGRQDSHLTLPEEVFDSLATLVKLSGRLAEGDQRNARFARALTLRGGGRDERSLRIALEDASWLLELDPNNAKAAFIAARSHAELGHLERAVDVLRRYLQLQPSDQGVLLEFAMLLLESGRHNEASDVLVRLLPEGGDDTEFVQSLLNRALVGAGEELEAMKRIDEALEAVPNSSLLHTLKGELLGRQERFDEEADAYRRAVETASSPDERRHALGHLGFILRFAGEPGQAEAVYEQMTLHSVRDREAVEAYAEVLEDAQDFLGAFRHRAALQEAYPDSLEDRTALIQLLHDWSLDLRDSGELRIAEKINERAYAALKPLQPSTSPLPRVRYLLAVNRYRAARISLFGGNFLLAETRATDAFQAIRGASQLDPDLEERVPRWERLLEHARSLAEEWGPKSTAERVQKVARQLLDHQRAHQASELIAGHLDSYAALGEAPSGVLRLGAYAAARAAEAGCGQWVSRGLSCLQAYANGLIEAIDVARSEEETVEANERLERLLDVRTRLLKELEDDAGSFRPLQKHTGYQSVIQVLSKH